MFVAVEVAQPVIDAVGAAVASLQEQAPALRWVEADKYHLTLVFLGSVDASLVAAVRDGVAGACRGASPFSLALTGRLGTFRSGVLWAELAESEPLSALAGAVTRVMTGLAAGDGAGQMRAPETRSFSAHLTLARAPRGGRVPAALRAATVPAGAWTVDRVVLMESRLSPKGARYTVDTAFPLAV